MGKDTDIREAVQAELSDDPLVDAEDITVGNLGGDVALGGTVRSYPQNLEAAEAAWRVAGVTSVHNQLRVVLPPGDHRDDAMLTTAANDALAANVTVPEGIEATAKNGNLTLTGHVRTRAERNAVVGAAWMGYGVMDVVDKLEVTG